MKVLFLPLHQLIEMEGELALRGSRCSSQNEPLEDGLHDLVGVHRHGDGYAQAVPDRLVLAEQHIQHDAVNLVVHRRSR